MTGKLVSKDKFSAMGKLASSRGYALVTDKHAILSIPYVDLSSLDNVVTIAAQRAMLSGFVTKIQTVIAEHEKAVELMVKRADRKVKLKAKRSTNVTKSARQVSSKTTARAAKSPRRSR